jgi:hypothetical protein
MKTIIINTCEIFRGKKVKVTSEASIDGSYIGRFLEASPKKGVLVEQNCGSDSFVNPKECTLILDHAN